MNLGPIELVFVLFVWLLPLLLLIWFLRAVAAIRDSVQRIEKHLESLDRDGRPGT